MNKQNCIEQIHSHLRNIEALIAEFDSNSLAQSFFFNSISFLASQVCDEAYVTAYFKMRTEVQEGLFGIDENELLHLLKFLSSNENKYAFLLEDFITTCYCYGFKERFTLLYETLLIPELQSALVSDQVAYNKTFSTLLILALYGHSYFLNRNPTIIRVVAPLNTGEITENGKKKGKKPKVPQKDMVLFLYNADEIQKRQSCMAVVSIDGKKLITIPISHNRVKWIKRPSLVNKTLNSGVYIHRDAALPVVALMPFWQRRFVDLLEEDLHSHYNRETKTTLWRCASRFLGDRYTPKEYWEELNSVESFKEILNQKRKLVGERILSPSEKTAFKLMTIV